MFSLFLRPEDTSPSTSCLTPHMKHNHATLQTLHQQEPCRQEQHSLFKTKLISSIVSNHLYKCPDAYKSQTLIRAFSLVPHIGSYKHTCTVSAEGCNKIQPCILVWACANCAIDNPAPFLKYQPNHNGYFLVPCISGDCSNRPDDWLISELASKWP